MNNFTSEANERYRSLVSQFGDQLPDVVARLDALAPIQQKGDIAEYALDRIVNGGAHVFLVDFIRDSDCECRVHCF
jgi:hypothetical protein